MIERKVSHTTSNSNNRVSCWKCRLNSWDRREKEDRYGSILSYPMVSMSGKACRNGKLKNKLCFKAIRWKSGIKSIWWTRQTENFRTFFPLIMRYMEKAYFYILIELVLIVLLCVLTTVIRRVQHTVTRFFTLVSQFQSAKDKFLGHPRISFPAYDFPRIQGHDARHVQPLFTGPDIGYNRHPDLVGMPPLERSDWTHGHAPDDCTLNESWPCPCEWCGSFVHIHAWWSPQSFGLHAILRGVVRA